MIHLHAEYKRIINELRLKTCRVVHRERQIQVGDVSHFILTEMNEEEVKAVVNMLKTIRLHNGDVYGYFEHLALQIPRRLALPLRQVY